MTGSLVARVAQWTRDQRLATPVHLFCQRAVTDALERLRVGLDARISYAVKANTHPLMLRAVADVDEYNVTNTEHLQLLLSARVAPSRIAFVNPAIDRATAETALRAGVTRFVVDDERGLELLTSFGTGLRLTLRLRPEQDGGAARSVIRFGTGPQQLTALALQAVSAGATVEAVSFFIGTHHEDLASAAPYRHALRETANVLAKLSTDGVDVPRVNIGGGFPGARRRFYRDHPHFFDRLNDAAHDMLPIGVRLLCEPGRYLAEPSMAMLTTVVADRIVAGHRMTHVDASGYSGLFETTFIDDGGGGLDVLADGPEGDQSVTQILGPIMDSFDVVKRNALLPPLHDGDALLLPNTGAYAFGYAARCEGVRQPHVVPLPENLDAALATRWSRR